MIWLLLSLLWCLLTIGTFLLLKRRYAALIELETSTPDPSTLPTLTVLIPARDEADNIGPCLESLTQQSYAPNKLQIIVIDDGSSDATAQITQHYKGRSIEVRLIEAGHLPSGWLGKSHACWVGSKHAHTEWICFVDADTRHESQLLASAVHRAVRENIDLLSLLPRQEMMGFWERVLMPISFMSLMILLDAERINDRSSSLAMAIGQFILIKKEVYDGIDGHAAIRDQVLEDVALARRVKSAGYNLKLFGGEELIRTRMYSGLKALWEGLARGGSELFGPVLTSFAIISSSLTAILPLAYPLWQTRVALETLEGMSFLSAFLASLGTASWYAAHLLAFQAYRVPFRYLLLLPFSNLLLAIVNAEGLIRRASGQRIWKGRNI